MIKSNINRQIYASKNVGSQFAWVVADIELDGIARTFLTSGAIQLIVFSAT
jgi:hypothetical protein